MPPSSNADAAPRPLAGRTIVVTRSRDQASALSRRLQELGATVIEIPTIAIVPPQSYEPLDAALAQLQLYDWLVITSANTAHVLAQRLVVRGLALSGQPRTVAVGPATAEALRQHGWRVDLVPQPAVAESIVSALRGQVRGKRVLIARAEVARDLLPLALEEAGAEVVIVHAYRTVLAEASESIVAEAFGTGAGQSRATLDGLTFTSSSTVRNLAALLEKARAPWPAAAQVFSIGPITSRTLREHSIEPDWEAAEHDVEGLVASVVKAFSQGDAQ